MAEEVSISLLRYYDEHFGCPLHHNVDKELSWAGAAEPAFGGGEVLRPMQLFLAGRATTDVGGAQVPVVDLAVAAARECLKTTFHCLDPSRHVEIRPLLRPGSRELVELFQEQQGTGDVLANDTSCGVGFAPFSALERVVRIHHDRLGLRLQSTSAMISVLRRSCTSMSDPANEARRPIGSDREREPKWPVVRDEQSTARGPDDGLHLGRDVQRACGERALELPRTQRSP